MLWEGSGWKRVGMSELIVPGRVKLVYMRGIGVCHPDKVCAFILVWGGGVSGGGMVFLLTEVCVGV